MLLLDAGNLIGDSMIADLTKGNALIEALNHLQDDALAVGNHEPDFDMKTLRLRSTEAKFPLLAAPSVVTRRSCSSRSAGSMIPN